MAGGRRRAASAASKAVVVEEEEEEEKVSVKDGNGEDAVTILEDSTSESEIAQLREQWELASVLNFVSVFEPVLGSDLKLTAEEIEAGLVKPNKSLSQLHITLLKGIPPVSKALNGSDAWVTVLCKKLAAWWPWVAEGEVPPLTAAKGEAISKYRELDPTNRLLILKALCEIRADQHDVVSFINDALKNGTEISSFRKNKIGGDGRATYWCDGNTVIGHRLYKEVRMIPSKTRMKGKSSKSLPAVSLQWKTLATNLEEFQNAADKLLSSKVSGEVAVGKAIASDVLPIVEKLRKKKERALKRKERQDKFLNDFKSYGAGVTRSCRNRKPVSYTFDEYDRAIDEAIEMTKKRKAVEEKKNEREYVKQRKMASNGVSDMATDFQESYGKKGDSDVESDSEDRDVKEATSLNSETESDKLKEVESEEDDDSKEVGGNNSDSKINDDDNGGESGNSDAEEEYLGDRKHSQGPVGSRCSKRLAGATSHPTVGTRNLGAKQRLRQRPVRNSAFDFIVPDSDDENSSKYTGSGISPNEGVSPVADSEGASDG